MNYKNVFAIDNTHYNQLNEEKVKKESKYQLNNYDYYEPKLIDDFYLKYFIREVLIEIDVLEVDEFLEYHYDKSSNTKLFLKILKYKILPKIEEVIVKAEFTMSEGGYYNEIKLEDGFIETENRILKPEYEDALLYHIVCFQNLQEDIKGRKSFVSEFFERNNTVKKSDETPKLIWSGKPSHLAYFVSQLIEENYIEPPRKKEDGDINQQELSRNILNSFSFEQKEPSIETLRKYSNTDSEKFIELNERFSNSGFHLPNSKILG
ncbi:MAG: hypothetical protein V7719_17825 [Psychroserpens sp.]|uniref:hypothetical protein n=1 Tax=Psychroserpens sp. TaxID=2020870 RepID=UPI003002EB42